MRAKRPTRRLTAFASAGALVAATLIAGAVAARPATADSRHGQDREARGAAIAAARAAKAGINWQLPADWGFEKPIQCGWVSVPLDYAHPYGRPDQARRRPRSGTPGPRRSARARSSTTRVAPAVRACASRAASPPRRLCG